MKKRFFGLGLILVLLAATGCNGCNPFASEEMKPLPLNVRKADAKKVDVEKLTDKQRLERIETLIRTAAEEKKKQKGGDIESRLSAVEEKANDNEGVLNAMGEES